MTPEEVAAAAAYLKSTIGKEGVQELIGKLSRDKGHIMSSIYIYIFCYIYIAINFLATVQIFNVLGMLQKTGICIGFPFRSKENTPIEHK